ncbi:MAG TPA: helix-hairpin-helix domain-containing protein [Syntrophomonadaceae bacterium]|nr:helix-hairpin-helix domain-containing protein [Syntrophomonadaceae bacterium]
MPEIDRRLAVAAFVLLLLGFVGGMKYSEYRFQQQAKKQSLLETAAQAQTVPTSPAVEKVLQVYVSGAVKNPGVYTLKEGDRVYQAVDMAGGALPEAELKNFNMAARLQDSQQVLIPLPGETPASSASMAASANPAQTAPGAGGTSPGGKININTAAISELDSLDGIGPALAQRVVDYRQAHGAFQKIEDIKNVSGIGDKKFQAIQDRICVN